jgi:hypothetical protein
MRARHVLVLLALLACKSDKKPDQVKPTGAAPAVADEPDEPEPVGPGGPAVTADGLKKLLPPSVGLPIPFAAVSIDGTAPLPDALSAGVDGSGWWTSPDYPGAAVDAFYEEGLVISVSFALPKTGGREALTALWGPPVVGAAFRGEGEQEERVAWFDPAKRLRAWIFERDGTPRVEIERYTPVLELLRVLREVAAPLLGQPLEAAASIPGAHFDADMGLAGFPPQEWDAFGGGSTTATGITLHGDGRIERIYLRLFYGSPAHREELLAAARAAGIPNLGIDEMPESMSIDLSLRAP